MPTYILVVSIFFLLVLGELGIIIRFLLRLKDLKAGKTDFKISKLVPAMYLIVMIPIVHYMLGTKLDPYGVYSGKTVYWEDYSLLDFLGGYLRINVVLVLYPILTWLRKRKIETLQPKPSQAK